jgi:hypothetical protein
MNTINLKINIYSKFKRFKPVAVLFSVVVFFTSCELNNPVGEISAPGHIAANIYWDIPVTNVTAGNEVEFYAEYWSVEDQFEYLGVWYDVHKNMKYVLTHPGSGYAFTLDSTELSREMLEIKTFGHSSDNYDAEKKAYVIEDKFPVSYTLSSLEYKNPITFNEEQFNQLIPENVKLLFLDEVFPLLTYEDFRSFLVTENQIVDEETFAGYFDEITEGEVTTYVMKEEAEPELKAHLNEVPFSSIIYNKNRQYYAVEFTQGFELNARFKIVNGNGTENLSDNKTITVF